MTELVCKRSGEDANHRKRPASRPGPYCATCRRDRKRETSQRAHDRRVEAFGLTAAEYRLLYEAQGGRCYICTRATGKAKRLAIEHDHALAAEHGHPEGQCCRKCVRGLACGWCNYEVLGRLGDRPETYERLAIVLRNPPARSVLL